MVFQIELRSSTKFMEQFSTTQLRDYLGIIREAIVDGQSRGVFRSDVNPTFAAKLVFGALDEMATNWILSRRKYSLVAEADQIVDLLVGGFAGHGHARHERRGQPPRRPFAPPRCSAPARWAAQVAAHLANAGFPVRSARHQRRSSRARG